MKNYQVVNDHLEKHLSSYMLSPKKKSTRDETALKRAIKYVEFVEKHQRNPTNNSNKSEKSLHNWMQNFKKNHQENYPQTYAYLRAHLNTGDNWKNTRDDSAMMKAEQLLEYLKKNNNKRPNRLSKNEKEKKLGVWYSNYVSKPPKRCVEELFGNASFSDGTPLARAKILQKPTKKCTTRRNAYWNSKDKLHLMTNQIRLKALEV